MNGPRRQRIRRALLARAAGALLLTPLQALPAEALLCTQGRAQSPIDIVSTHAQTGAPLRFDYRPTATRVVNDGHTVRLRHAAGNTLRVGRERLALQQSHFHTPAGDRLHGETFPLAMHLLHRAPSGQLVPLVLLFRLGAENAALAALLPLFPNTGAAEHVLPGPAHDPTALLPTGAMAAGYYAYTGSLTAPPCTEGVRWIVLRQVQTVSAAQLARLGALFPENGRAVQALNGRVVAEHP
jgi:carbonic anhydrase